MGGPVAGVVLRAPLSEAQRAWIETGVVDRVSYSRQGNDFSAAQTTGIGGKYKGQGLPFYVEWENGVEIWEDDRILNFEAGFGFWPEWELNLGCMTKCPDSHRVLGELTLHLAENLDGIVDFHGAIMPPNRPDLWWGREWPEVEQEVSDWLRTIKGRIVALPYWIPISIKQGPTVRWWASHCADAEFLKNWLKHPHFHMIK